MLCLNIISICWLVSNKWKMLLRWCYYLVNVDGYSTFFYFLLYCFIMNMSFILSISFRFFTCQRHNSLFCVNRPSLCDFLFSHSTNIFRAFFFSGQVYLMQRRGWVSVPLSSSLFRGMTMSGVTGTSSEAQTHPKCCEVDLFTKYSFGLPCSNRVLDLIEHMALVASN